MPSFPQGIIHGSSFYRNDRLRHGAAKREIEGYYFARADWAAVALIDTRWMRIAHSALLKDGLGLAGVEDMADSHGPHVGRLADI